MNALIITGAIVLLLLLIIFLLVRYGYRYLATEETRKMTLPGDDLLAKDDQVLVFSKEIIIDAPAENVWKYAAQQGQTKAGFYSFVLLERLFTFKITNTYNLVPEWTKIKPGEWVYYHQMGIGSQIMEVKEGEYFTMLSDTRRPPVGKGKAFALRAIPGGEFAWTWNFITLPLDGNRCKLVQRCHCFLSPNNGVIRALVKFFLGIPSIVMTTRQMQVIKACAENRFPKQQKKS